MGTVNHVTQVCTDCVQTTRKRGMAPKPYKHSIPPIACMKPVCFVDHIQDVCECVDGAALALLTAISHMQIHKLARTHARTHARMVGLTDLRVWVGQPSPCPPPRRTRQQHVDNSLFC